MAHYDRYFLFFFNDTATTEIYTLSLHDALPISAVMDKQVAPGRSHVDPAALELLEVNRPGCGQLRAARKKVRQDRKSTRLNSSHANISYAVFCLKKKKITT